MVIIVFFQSRNQLSHLAHCISELRISFLDLFLYRDGSSSVLKFSTFQEPLNKYLYIPFESFHPYSGKKAFIKGEVMRYARNSSYFNFFFRRLGKDSGSGYGWEGTQLHFCYHCFAKYNTATERSGFCRKPRIGLSWLLYSRLPLIAVTHVLGMLSTGLCQK